jgi:ferredoxin, 2Fe-2S
MSITIHFIAGNIGSYWAEDKTEVKIKAKVGQSLMQAAVTGHVGGIAADCGGCLTCATCHVVLEPFWAAFRRQNRMNSPCSR